MNIAQERIVKSLKQDILAHDSHGPGNEYEYKHWEVTEEADLVFVLSQVGRKGDEGTMAEVFARTTRHIMIKQNGCCMLLNAKPRRKGHPNPTVKGYSRCLYWVTEY
jgi:hypothetical protein